MLEPQNTGVSITHGLKHTPSNKTETIRSTSATRTRLSSRKTIRSNKTNSKSKFSLVKISKLKDVKEANLKMRRPRTRNQGRMARTKQFFTVESQIGSIISEKQNNRAQTALNSNRVQNWSENFIKKSYGYNN